MLDRIGRLRHGGRLATGRRTAQQRASRIPDQNDVVAVPASADGNGRQLADGLRHAANQRHPLERTAGERDGVAAGRPNHRRWAQPGGEPGDPGERLSSRLAQRPHQDPAGPIESLDCQQEMTTVRRDRKQVFGRRRQRLLKTLKRRGVRTRRWSHAEEADRTSRADDKAGKGRDPREPRRDTPRLACNRGAVPRVR